LLTEAPPAVHLAGLTVEMDSKARAGRRARSLRLDGGEQIDRRRSYAVTVPETLLHRAEDTGLAGHPSTPVGVTDRDALLRYIRLLRQPVEAPGTERVVYRK
jgi:hypothetical protein